LTQGIFDLEINNNIVKLGGSLLMINNQQKINWDNSFKSSIYIPEGTEIFLNLSSIRFLIIEIYSIDNFTPKLIEDSQVVPNGKKWKVTNILASEFGEGQGHSININGVGVLAGGGDCYDCSPVERRLVNFVDGAFWLPEGSTLEPGLNTHYVSVLEFDSSQSSVGGGSGGGSNQSNNNQSELAAIGEYKWDIPGWDFDSFGSGSSSSSTYITNDRIFYYPISLSESKDYSEIGFFPDSNWQDLANPKDLIIGIFTFQDGFPGDLIYSFPITTYQATFNQFELSFSLDAGNYFVGILNETTGLSSHIELKTPHRYANNSSVRAICPFSTPKSLSIPFSVPTGINSGNTYILSKDSSQAGFPTFNSDDFIEMTYGGYILFKEN
jgi:hypothetical protein